MPSFTLFIERMGIKVKKDFVVMVVLPDGDFLKEETNAPLTLYPLTLVEGCGIGRDEKLLLALTYRKGHQGSNSCGHIFAVTE